APPTAGGGRLDRARDAGLHPGAPTPGDVPAAPGGRRRGLRLGHRRDRSGQHPGAPRPPGRPAGRPVYLGRPPAPTRGAGGPDRRVGVWGTAPGGGPMTPSDTKSTVLLNHHLKVLNLSTVL